MGLVPMDADELRRLATETRLYARSKGLALAGQAIVFTLGACPLVWVARASHHLPVGVAALLYVGSAVVYLGSVWVALALVPGALDRLYYWQTADASAQTPETPTWATGGGAFLLLAPVGAAALGWLDEWQATVVSLVGFGLLVFAVGRYWLQEPASQMIGATTAMLGSVLALTPGATLRPDVGDGGSNLMAAQYAALGIAMWLFVSWIVGALGLHVYNRRLLGRLARSAKEHLEDDEHAEERAECGPPGP